MTPGTSHGELGNGGPPTDAGVAQTGGGVSSDTAQHTAIAAGYYHVCGVTSSSVVKCWGLNDHGQLGTFLTGDQLTP